MKTFNLVLTIFFSLNFSYTQEINAKIIVNSESINQTNSSVFKNLEISLSNFINNSSWSNVNYSEFEKVDLNVLLSITSYSNNSYVQTLNFKLLGLYLIPHIPRLFLTIKKRIFSLTMLNTNL